MLESLAELHRADRAPARVDDGRVRGIAGMHHVVAAIVVAFLGIERADDVQVVHLPGHLGQMLRDFHTRSRGVDRPEGPAVLLAVWFQVPDVEVAGASPHPEHDAASVGLSELCGRGFERRKELDRRDAERRGGEVPQPVPPSHLTKKCVGHESRFSGSRGGPSGGAAPLHGEVASARSSPSFSESRRIRSSSAEPRTGLARPEGYRDTRQNTSPPGRARISLDAD